MPRKRNSRAEEVELVATLYVRFLLYSKNAIIMSSTKNVLLAENQQERLDYTVEANDISISQQLGGYIAGFVDGEGSFNISLRKKKDYSVGWQPVLSFNVSQKEKTMLLLLLQIFKCGILKRRRDGLYSYDVTSPIDLSRNIVPFFQKFSFFSKRKKTNFNLFKSAVKIMVLKKHLSQDGLRELLVLREKINVGKGRTRKYCFQDVFQESSETIR